MAPRTSVSEDRVLTKSLYDFIWVDSLGRDSIIGCVGNSGKFVSLSKV